MGPDKIYLCDSGAQYLYGTTDITRTVHFGKPSAHEKECYTAVVKGHVALRNARFPKGTNGYIHLIFLLELLCGSMVWIINMVLVMESGLTFLFMEERQTDQLRFGVICLASGSDSWHL